MTLETISRQSSFYYVQWQDSRYYRIPILPSFLTDGQLPLHRGMYHVASAFPLAHNYRTVLA